MRFIVDSNAGKLARWLRMMGYDTLFFREIEDSQLVGLAAKEDRVLVTRDTHIAERRAVTSGKVKAIITRFDDPVEQLLQVIRELHLDFRAQFSRCIECNQPLVRRALMEVRHLVPPYVQRTQVEYRQCPLCGRVYWKGTHWQRMKKALEDIQAAEPLET